MNEMKFVVLGEPASKSNSRTLVCRKGGKPRNIKSKKALSYVDNFILQVKSMNLPKIHEGDIIFKCWIYYASYKPDLDESLIMDCLQKSGVIRNDRQIKEKHIYHGIDRKNPHVVIILQKLIDCPVPL